MVNLFWILGFGVKTVRVLMMKTEKKKTKVKQEK